MACSNRVSKPRPRKPGLSSVERKEQLAAAIDCFGVITRTPCGSCVRHGEVECRVGLRSGRCSHCSRHGRKCDLIVTRQEWDSLKCERQQLGRQIDDVDRDLEKLLQKRVELRKRSDALEDRAGEAAVREQANIEQLERFESTTSSTSSTSSDASENPEAVSDLGFLQQDLFNHPSLPTNDAQPYSAFEAFDPNPSMSFQPWF